MWPFDLQRKKTTCSDAGKAGAAARRYRERTRIRAKVDKMRAAAGLPEAEWPQ